MGRQQSPGRHLPPSPTVSLAHFANCEERYGESGACESTHARYGIAK